MAPITGTLNVESRLRSLGLPRGIVESVGRAVQSIPTGRVGLEQLAHSMDQALQARPPLDSTARGSATGFVPRPAAYLKASLSGTEGFGGLSAATPFGASRLGNSVGAAMQGNPAFRAQLEKALGGMLVENGGSSSGALTVFRPESRNAGGTLRNALQQQLIAPSPLVSAIAGLNIPVATSGLSTGSTGSILRGLQGLEANIMGLASSMSDSQATGDQDSASTQALADGMGIDLENASFEDTIMLLLMKYAQKKEKEVGEKVSALDKSMSAKESSKAAADGTSTAATDGTTTGATDGADAQEGLYGGLTGSAGGTTGESLTSSAGDTSIDGTKVSDMSDTMKQQMLTKLMNDLQKMYEMLSNMMKSMHDMQMTPIRNLRG